MKAKRWHCYFEPSATPAATLFAQAVHVTAGRSEGKTFFLFLCKNGAVLKKKEKRKKRRKKSCHGNKVVPPGVLSYVESTYFLLFCLKRTKPTFKTINDFFAQVLSFRNHLIEKLWNFCFPTKHVMRSGISEILKR